MTDIIIIMIVVVIVGTAVAYIVKEKKRGAKCIGCPSAGECAYKRSGCQNGTSCHKCKE